MPFQTNNGTHIFFPDGCKLEAKREGSPTWLDIGCISGDTTAIYNFDENVVQFGNCDDSAKQIKNQTLTGDFELANLDPDGLFELSGGAFVIENTTGAPIVAVDNQVIANGSWANVTAIPLSLVETSSSNDYKATTFPVIATVTGSVDGALLVNDDYSIVTDNNARSGFSIVLNTAGAILTTIAQNITIVYTSFIPITAKILSTGNSTDILTPFQFRFTHTDDNGKIRRLDMFRVDTNSGSFNFGFKGQNSDGVEMMPISFTARTDSSRDAKKQLMQWTIEENAS